MQFKTVKIETTGTLNHYIFVAHLPSYKSRTEFPYVVFFYLFGRHLGFFIFSINYCHQLYVDLIYQPHIFIFTFVTITFAFIMVSLIIVFYYLAQNNIALHDAYHFNLVLVILTSQNICQSFRNFGHI